MIQITAYEMFSVCFSSFAVGFALCNVIYQFAKSSDRRTRKRKKSGLGKKPPDVGGDSNKETENGDH